MDSKDPIGMLRLLAANPTRSSIDCETIQNFIDEIEAAYMRLPVDADGVPIRTGDMMECICAEEPYPFKAWFVSSTTDFLSDKFDFYNASECRHAKPDTVKELLAEYAIRRDRLETAMDAPGSDMTLGDLEEAERNLTADYAERIRKAVQDE